MAPSIQGTYQLEQNENFVAYLSALGIPEDKAKGIDSLRPKLQVAVDGNKISLVSDSGVQNSSTTFVIGQEVDENILDGSVVKSTATLDGNKLTIQSKGSDGKVGSRVYNFTDNGIELVFSHDHLKTVAAKRIYKRL